MEFFGNIIKGIMIGIANIIPGVSGGTMAVSLGIYDRLIGSISGLFREFKKSILFLIPIIIGAGIGIVGFTYAIEYLLDKHTFVTCMAFVGLILGGLPAIFSSMRAKVSSGGVGVFGILAFVIAFAISGGMPLLKESKDALTVIAVTPGNMVILFILGIVASATMVIPGVSGSMMLMIFGYYYAIINTIKTFLDNLRAFDLAGMKEGILLLAPFGIGVVLGIFLIAKLITFLFEKYGVQTFCAILGLVISSPIAIFINTGLVSKLDVAQAKSVYFSTKASVPQLESGISQYINSLAILLGTYPQEIRPTLERIGKLPDYMEPVGVGLPADLLLRRPDVRQAERLVNAQAALLGASKSDWLPQVFLKGSVGYAARDLKDLTRRKSMTFEIAPTLSWTLFSGTKLVNATKQARAQLDEAVHNFNETVLTAVQETDNAMNNYRNSIKQIVALREVRNQGQETLKLSLELYKQGLSPFQNVLDALRSLLTYENQLTQAEGSSLLYLVSLYQALGGGYKEN